MTVRVAASPCTPKTQRCADARDYGSELAECCRDHIIGIMRTLVPLLNECGATWWADYGTLLGAVRNPLTVWADYPWLPQSGRTTPGPVPGIVPHDKDGDLGLLVADWDRAMRLRKSLLKAGYHASPNVHRASMKVRVSFRNHTNADLFFWRERPDGTLYRDRYAQVDQFKGKEFPKALLSPATTVEWEGLTLPAPADPEAFLAMRYGPSWIRPLMANHDGQKRP